MLTKSTPSMPDTKLTPYQFFAEKQRLEKARAYKLKSYKKIDALDTSSLQDYMDCRVYPRYSKENGELRFELAGPVTKSTQLGCGMTGYVLPSKATLTPNGVRRDTGRVIKLFHTDTTEETICRDRHGARLMPHLHAKETSGKWIVMKHMPGDSLPRILKLHQLHDAEQVFELTQAILDAYKQQIADPGLIHFDIKPDNMVVNLSSPIMVNFVDSGSVVREVDYHQHRNKRCSGTPMYQAKEVSSKKYDKISQKSDIYSLGKSLAQLWQDDDVKRLVDKQTRKSVDLLIEPMLDRDPANRPAIDEIIDELHELFSFTSPTAAGSSGGK